MRKMRRHESSEQRIAMKWRHEKQYSISDKDDIENEWKISQYIFTQGKVFFIKISIIFLKMHINKILNASIKILNLTPHLHLIFSKAIKFKCQFSFSFSTLKPERLCFYNFWWTHICSPSFKDVKSAFNIFK